MARFDFEGVDELVAQFERIQKQSTDMIGHAVYEGANTAMRYIVAGIDTIVTDNNPHGTPDKPCNGPTTYQKEGLYRSVGIAKARYDGNFFNVKIGFDGYNGLSTKTWPNGQPNSLVARAVQSGTSWMRKQPFMRKAEEAARGPVEAVMTNVVNTELEKMVK